MGITEILRRNCLFSANKIKSSETFSKQPTQLIIAAHNCHKEAMILQPFCWHVQCMLQFGTWSPLIPIELFLFIQLPHNVIKCFLEFFNIFWYDFTRCCIIFSAEVVKKSEKYLVKSKAVGKKFKDNSTHFLLVAKVIHDFFYWQMSRELPKSDISSVRKPIWFKLLSSMKTYFQIKFHSSYSFNTWLLSTVRAPL